MGSGQREVEKRVVAYRLKLSTQAVREAGEAYEWYEAQSQGLGSEYEAALELQLRSKRACRMRKFCPVFDERCCPDFPTVFSIPFETIWCRSLLLFTTSAIPSGGPVDERGNR